MQPIATISPLTPLRPDAPLFSAVTAEVQQGKTDMSIKSVLSRMMASTSVAALSLFGAHGVAFAGPNLVQNGGFEQTTGLDPDVFNESQGVDDWDLSSASVNLVMPQNIQTGFPSAIQYLYAPSNGFANGLTVSPNGGNFLASDGDYYYRGPITQTINGLTPGQKYDVSFYWGVGQAFGFGPTDVEDQFQVSLGGETQSTAFAPVSGGGFSGWMHQDFVFTSTDVSENLSFLAIGGGVPPMALLDGVSMNSVPEPSTWAMLLTGFGGLAFAARLRRRMVKAPRAEPAESPG